MSTPSYPDGEREERGISKSIFLQKEPGLFGEMDNSQIGADKLQDESGISI